MVTRVSAPPAGLGFLTVTSDLLLTQHPKNELIINGHVIESTAPEIQSFDFSFSSAFS